MTHRLLCMAFVLILITSGAVPGGDVIQVASKVWADSEGRDIAPPDGGKSFADQDIATITLDYGKIKNTIPAANYFSSSAKNKFVWNYDTSSGNITIERNDIPIYGYNQGSCFINPGEFSLTYPDAAVFPDGTRGDVTLNFTNIRLATKYLAVSANRSADTYSAKIQLFDASGGHPYPALTIVSGNASYRIGVRAKVGVTISNTNNTSNTQNTFIYTAYGFNVSREQGTQKTGFGELVYASANAYWSESISPPSGSSVGNEMRSVDFGNNGGASYAGNGGTNSNSYGSGIALTTNPAQELHFVRSGSGLNSGTTDSYFLTDGITHTTTSSSGDGGKIEIWTSGRIDSGTQLRDDEQKVRTYDVPDGKVAEYKLTPKDGYIIDTLYVNKSGTSATSGEKVVPTEAVLDGNGKPSYYVYRFDADDKKDQSIHVTWQKANTLKVIKTWEGDDDWNNETRPGDLSIRLLGNGNAYYGHDADCSKVATDGANYDPDRIMDDTWVYEFKNLPSTDKDGNKIIYDHRA